MPPACRAKSASVRRQHLHRKQARIRLPAMASNRKRSAPEPLCRHPLHNRPAANPSPLQAGRHGTTAHPAPEPASSPPASPANAPPRPRPQQSPAARAPRQKPHTQTSKSGVRCALTTPHLMPLHAKLAQHLHSSFHHRKSRSCCPSPRITKARARVRLTHPKNYKSVAFLFPVP